MLQSMQVQYERKKEKKKRAKKVLSTTIDYGAERLCTNSRCLISSSSKYALAFAIFSLASSCLATGGQLTARISPGRTMQKDFGPKLIHQPPSVQVKANEPHTIECPVEAQPEAEVKWFKDNQLLASEPTHLEQTQNELMFFQINQNDQGQYHCEATNYLGSISSELFTLSVQSSEHDASIRFEPRVAEVNSEQQVEFTCTIPALDSSASSSIQRNKMNWRPEVSWRRNGAKLNVRWLSTSSADNSAADESSDSKTRTSSTSSSRFVARQLSASEFALILVRAQQKDNNSTFTCLYHEPTTTATTTQEDEQSESSQLAHESSPVLLKVYQQQQRPIHIDTDLAPPIESLHSARNPNLQQQQQNQTTQLVDPTTISSSSSSITKLTAAERSPIQAMRQTLESLFELAKPTLIIFGLLFVLSLIVILQLVLVRRRANNNQNRYIKHQQFLCSSSGSAASSGSATSGNQVQLDCHSAAAAAVAAAADPILNSLLSRTLSAPSAVSLNTTAAATSINPKQSKYRSYRDHMHKVAAATNTNDMVSLAAGDDLVDGYLAVAQHLQQQAAAAVAAAAARQNQHQDHEQAAAPTQTAAPFSFALNPPQQQQPLGASNLYNQSLAAREQARTLLQASEHMRSLSNLSHITAAAAAAVAAKQTAANGTNSANNNNNNNKQNIKHGLMRLAHQQHQPQQQLNGSHLNLANFANFAFANQTTNNVATAQMLLSAADQHHQNSSHNRLVSESTCNIWPTTNNSDLTLLNSNRLNQLHQQQQRLQPPGGAAYASNGEQASANSEHYQLVNCSSVSPSSTCSMGGSHVSSSNNNNNQMMQQQHTRQTSKISDNFQQLDVSSLNHYSTIGNNEIGDDEYAVGSCFGDGEKIADLDDDCYEQVDQPALIKRSSAHLMMRNTSCSNDSNNKHKDSALQQQHKTSTFVTNNTTTNSNCEQATSHFNQKSSLRSSFMSSTTNSSSSGCASGESATTTTNSISTGGAGSDCPIYMSRFNSNQTSNNHQQSSRCINTTRTNKHNSSNFKDQLSPYAVSSICGAQHRQQPPPPVNSEAMQALNEQFDINQLMLLDESANLNNMPVTFDAPPPPPPPQPPTSDDDKNLDRSQLKQSKRKYQA